MLCGCWLYAELMCCWACAGCRVFFYRRRARAAGGLNIINHHPYRDVRARMYRYYESTKLHRPARSTAAQSRNIVMNSRDKRPLENTYCYNCSSIGLQHSSRGSRKYEIGSKDRNSVLPTHIDHCCARCSSTFPPTAKLKCKCAVKYLQTNSSAHSLSYKFMPQVTPACSTGTCGRCSGVYRRSSRISYPFQRRIFFSNAFGGGGLRNIFSHL